MVKSNQKLPIFVYGTLRNGFINYETYLRGYIEKEEPATIKGLLVDIGVCVPALLPGDKTVKGELMYVKDEHFENVLENIDRLEGYDPITKQGFYVRKLRTVLTQLGVETFAWVYMWGSAKTTSYGEIISGDYKNI